MGDSCSNRGLVEPNGDELSFWREVPEGGSSPFVHKFQTSRQKYVYDVNTRRIIRVSPVVWDVIEDVGRFNEREIALKHSPCGEADIAEAIGQIRLAQKQQGLFLPLRPLEIVPPASESIREKLDHQREQLILNVTDSCNFRCSYCVYGGGYPHHRTHSTNAMSWEVAQRAIDDFLTHSGHAPHGRVISFYGGEPLLNLELIKRCVLYAKQTYPLLELRFSLTTNGFLLRDEAAEFLASEQFLILVSLDGPAEMHDRHRRTAGGEATWAEIMKNLRDFLSCHPEYRSNGRIRFNAVVTPSTNLDEAQGFWGNCDLFNESMGLEIEGQRRPPSEPLPKGPLSVSARELHKQFLGALASGKFADSHAGAQAWVQKAVFERPFAVFHNRGYISPHLPQKMVFLNTCVPGARRTFVDVKGDYFACERVVPCRSQNIGNVRKGIDTQRVLTLLDEWHRANGRQCYNCWCLSACRMGCLATAGEDGTITEEAKRYACALHRRNTHRLLIQYCGILEENPHAFDYTEEYEFQ